MRGQPTRGTLRPPSFKGCLRPADRRVMARMAGLIAVGALFLAWSAHAAGDPDVAALQVSLSTRGLYAGTIDGEAGAATTAAVMAFQKRKKLVPDGIAGPATRKALGRFARPQLGSRTLDLGAVGWDVVALQFLLAWHGFPSGTFDGAFGLHVQSAVMCFQLYAGLPVVGFAGPRTVAALTAPLPRSPLALSWPLRAAVGDGFGPRGARFHAGIDIPAALGAPVGAAGSGVVTFAAPSDGFGNLVVIAHGAGVETFYAHLSSITVHAGQSVARGARVGLVGATGEATGPHLHLEVHVRGAAVDPLSALR